jgi:hypothetical protein
VAIVRDCGDFSAKIGFAIGLEFPPYVTPELQRQINDALSKAAAEIQSKRERMELELLDFVCEQLGYPEERVKALIESRTDAQNDAIEKEETGRAEKNRRRASR